MWSKDTRFVINSILMVNESMIINKTSQNVCGMKRGRASSMVSFFILVNRTTTSHPPFIQLETLESCLATSFPSRIQFTLSPLSSHVLLFLTVSTLAQVLRSSLMDCLLFLLVFRLSTQPLQNHPSYAFYTPKSTHDSSKYLLN